MRSTAAVIGCLVAIFPFAAALGVLFHPLRRRQNAGSKGSAAIDGRFIRICPLDALDSHGVPQLFPVVTDVVDAWSRTPGQRIGSVYLTRTEAGGKPAVACLSSTCPHLGCAVEWHAQADQFQCPCHESAFAKDGQKLFGPSLRGLDPLEVELVERDGQMQVLVDYERFRTGVKERIPLG